MCSRCPWSRFSPGADATLSVGGGGGARRFTMAKIWSSGPSARCRTAQLEHSELVFVGYGIVAPEYHWNDYAGIDVRGKTVLVLAGDPGYASKDPTVFKGNAPELTTDAGTTRSRRPRARARRACC